MRTCNKCSEYNRKEKCCMVAFLYEGEDYNLEIKDPSLPCLLEKNGLLDEVKSIRAWTDGKDGFIEYGGDS